MHRRPTPKQYPSDFIGGKPVLSTGYLVSCSRTQRSASGEARTRNPLISSQALYHDCAPQVGSILCRYDTYPTQYAPDLRGSILCMQGTQYAPRESKLCMEHFVALQCANTHTHTHRAKHSVSFSFIPVLSSHVSRLYIGHIGCTEFGYFMVVILTPCFPLSNGFAHWRGFWEYRCSTLLSVHDYHADIVLPSSTVIGSLEMENLLIKQLS